MFPDYRPLKLLPSQRGFLLPLALFIIVVMGVLALTISRTATQSQTAVVQEFMSLQSFYAAESGAQRGMKALFFDVNRRKDADDTCLTMNLTPDFSGVPGLGACSVVVSCTCLYQNGSNCTPENDENYPQKDYPSSATFDVLKSFYTVTSVGSCGEEEYRAERSIQVGAFLEQE